MLYKDLNFFSQQLSFQKYEIVRPKEQEEKRAENRPTEPLATGSAQPQPFLPESPRFYVKKGMLDKAMTALARVRGQAHDSEYVLHELAEIQARA